MSIANKLARAELVEMVPYQSARRLFASGDTAQANNKTWLNANEAPGEGEYQVFYANSDRKLKKPIIILDGFDPGDLRKIDNGTDGIRSLIDNQGKEENMKKFKAAGFDVVILNFPKLTLKTRTVKFWHPWLNRYIYFTIKTERDGGSDYVERNANVLKALNERYSGTKE